MNKTCNVCGKEFDMKKISQKYCNVNCRIENQNFERKKYKSEWYFRNKERIIPIRHKYYIENRKKIMNRAANYKKNNRERYNARKRQRKIDDPEFRILTLCRERIRQALKNNYKSETTKKLLGCTINELKKHLQKTAIENGYINFNINNYSGKDYHVDHIKPCALFDLSKKLEQKKCFNYTNLQILSAIDNLEKGDKYEEVELE